MFDSSRILDLNYRGAPQTVEVMRRAALESQAGAKGMVLRQLCEATCANLDSKDYLSEALAIGNLCTQRMRYMRDPKTVELVRAPYVIAGQILKGQIPNVDCDDMACFIAAAMMSMGATCQIITAAFADQFYEGIRQYSHVYTRVYEPRSKQWIVVDPVAADQTKKMLRTIRAVKIWEI